MASNERLVIKGFGNSATNSVLKAEEKELKTVEEVHAFIQKEIFEIDNFERIVKGEIVKIDDLENNLKAVLKKFDSLIILVKQRDKLVKSLIEESLKPKVDIDVGLCNNYLAMIQRIDQELNPMCNLLSRELSKFILPEYHHLYAESEDMRNKIKEISGRAGKIHAEFNYVWSNISISMNDLRNISEAVRRLEYERSLKQNSAANPVGYKY